MKTFAIRKSRSAPAVRKARSYVHHPKGFVQKAEQARIRRILRDTGAQAKLTVGQPNDKYEQEADRVADQVMAMSDAEVALRQPETEEEETLQTKPLADQITPLVQKQEGSPEKEDEPLRAMFQDSGMIQRMCPECEEETVQRQPEDEDEELQATSNSGGTTAVMPDLESKIYNRKSGGRPLDPATRIYFERRIGHDFSHVRVHTDSVSDTTAKAINARAFTLGNHVVMRSGEYQPTSQSGRRILAHELTHVVQQSRATSSRQGAVQRAAPAAAAPAVGLALLKKCLVGGLIGMAFDAAIQYGLHLWRLRRWPWERARETWESYRHNWCSTALSLVLGCFGAIAAHRWIQPLLRRYTRLGGAAGATLLGRLLMWLATQGILLPRIAVKWLAKLGCIRVFEAEALSPGITSEEALTESA